MKMKEFAIVSNSKCVHMFYNKEFLFLNALKIYADIFCISITTTLIMPE